MIAQARGAFSRYDVDGNGAIDRVELLALLSDLVGQVSEEDIRRFDTDGSGTFSFEEFARLYNHVQEGRNSDSMIMYRVNF